MKIYTKIISGLVVIWFLTMIGTSIYRTYVDEKFTAVMELNNRFIEKQKENEIMIVSQDYNFLGNAWRSKCGLPPEKKTEKISLEEIYKTQWSPKFEELCRNRMAMGFFRYGNVWETVGKFDNVGSAIERLKMYQETGNTEYLVDSATLCHCEFINGNHPTKHFHSIDDGKHTELKKGTQPL